MRAALAALGAHVAGGRDGAGDGRGAPGDQALRRRRPLASSAEGVA